MNKLFTLVFTFCSLFASAQTKISGRVVDQKGQTIPGANVFIKNSYDGASTNPKGEFSFTTTETGKTFIVSTFIGFNTVEIPVELNGTEITGLKLVLTEKVNQLNAVTITAGVIEASDNGKSVILRPLDIVTTAGGNGDINGAIQTLPGTQPMGETEGLVVRGGSVNEAKTVIDGLTVQHPYQSSVPDIAQRGRFSPFLFKNTVFSTGGYSAQYGQAMSSALILETQDLPDNVNSTNIALSSVGAGIGHQHRWARASVGVDLNYANLTPSFWVAKQKVDWNRNPQYGGGSFIFRYKPTKTGLLKIYATQSNSDLSLNTQLDTTGDLKKFTLQNSNTFITASYKEILSSKWSIYAGTSLSLNNDKRLVGPFNASSSDNAKQGKLMFIRSLKGLSTLRVGGEIQQVVNNSGTFLSPFNGYIPFRDTSRDKFYAGFAEMDWFFTNKLVARVGLRNEFSGLVFKHNLAPRISLAYKTGENSQLSFAYGDFYQSPLVNFLGSSNLAGLTYEKATHYIASYQVVEELRTFRTEFYYKKYSGLTKYLSFDPITGSFSGLDNSGSGYAKGIDIFWRDKKTFKYLDYWISYSYLNSKRNYLNYLYSAQPTFAADNTFNLVVKRFFIKVRTNLGFTYTFATGRPYFNPGKTTSETYLTDKTKPYQNLSVNASYLTNIKGHFTVLVVSCSNVLGINNIYGYRYDSTGNSRTALTTPSNRFLFLGMFISIGKDKYEGVD